VLSLFARKKSSRDRSLPVAEASSETGQAAGRAAVVAVQAGAACPLAVCAAGSQATVLEMRCGDTEACRLRALGLCEGARVNVVETRHAMLLDVRGTRIALGRALTAGITVQPLPG
jgi:Fe2+ transport system protein FeoA